MTYEVKEVEILIPLSKDEQRLSQVNVPNVKNDEDKITLLEAFQRLFRDNIFAEGIDIDDHLKSLPFMHLTSVGAEILKKDRRKP